MKELNSQELQNINGGAFKIGVGIGIVAGITFLIGVIDGYVRPLACRR